jgi:hypothetical protein
MAQPRNRVPYDIEEPHFVVAVFSPAGPRSDGVVFQASRSEAAWTSELRLAGGHVQARWVDSRGMKTQITAAAALAPQQAVVASLSSVRGAQQLRINGLPAGRAAASFAPSPCNQMLMGWGFLAYYPTPGFGGHLYAVIAGKGQPSPAELEVMERYLATTAGLQLAAAAPAAGPKRKTPAAKAGARREAGP